jgi:hypothetical protein
MDEDELQQYRRERLREWLKERGGAKKVCQQRHQSKNMESQISQILNGYSFGARAARTMEAKLGMAPGYLDDPGTGEPLVLTPEALRIAQWFDKLTDPIERAVAETGAMGVILRVLQHLPPTDTPWPGAQAETPREQVPPPAPAAPPKPSSTRSTPAGRSTNKAR